MVMIIAVPSSLNTFLTTKKTFQCIIFIFEAFLSGLNIENGYVLNFHKNSVYDFIVHNDNIKIIFMLDHLMFSLFFEAFTRGLNIRKGQVSDFFKNFDLSKITTSKALSCLFFKCLVQIFICISSLISSNFTDSLTH